LFATRNRTANQAIILVKTADVVYNKDDVRTS